MILSQIKLRRATAGVARRAEFAAIAAARIGLRDASRRGNGRRAARERG